METTFFPIINLLNTIKYFMICMLYPLRTGPCNPYTNTCHYGAQCYEGVCDCPSYTRGQMCETLLHVNEFLPANRNG